MAPVILGLSANVLIFSLLLIVNLAWTQRKMALSMRQSFSYLAFSATLAIACGWGVHAGIQALLRTFVDPQLPFFTGIAFYGCLSGAIIAIVPFVKLSKESHLRQARLYGFVYLLLMNWILLKMGCHLKGCCYGEFTPLPWAIVHTHAQSLMPNIGVPVHPVSIYSVILGLILLISFKCLTKFLSSYYAITFVALQFFIGRWFIEGFRGDLDPISLGWNANQWISIAFALIAVGFVIIKSWDFAPWFRGVTWARAIGLTLVAILCVSCKISEPGRHVIAKHEPLRGSVVQWVSFAGNSKRNILFSVVDAQIQQALKANRSSNALNGSRLESQVWNFLAPKLKRNYAHAAYIAHDSFNFENLRLAIERLEKERVPYDIVLLTHGFHNHLIGSEDIGGKWIISWQEIQSLGKLNYLETVYLQSCFGSTLAPDFKALGADLVISYDGLNANFFYPLMLLGSRYENQAELTQIALNLKQGFEKKFVRSPFYQIALRKLMGISPGKFLKTFQPREPNLDY